MKTLEEHLAELRKIDTRVSILRQDVAYETDMPAEEIKVALCILESASRSIGQLRLHAYRLAAAQRRATIKVKGREYDNE